MGRKTCYWKDTSGKSFLDNLSDGTGMWGWKKRLENLFVFLVIDEALFKQWRKCVYLLEYIIGKRLYQSMGMEAELIDFGGS